MMRKTAALFLALVMLAGIAPLRGFAEDEAAGSPGECAVCGEPGCILVHAYCEDCGVYDCGIEHGAAEPEASSPEASSPEASSPEASSPEASSPEASSPLPAADTGEGPPPALAPGKDQLPAPSPEEAGPSLDEDTRTKGNIAASGKMSADAELTVFSGSSAKAEMFAADFFELDNNDTLNSYTYDIDLSGSFEGSITLSMGGIPSAGEGEQLYVIHLLDSEEAIAEAQAGGRARVYAGDDLAAAFPRETAASGSANLIFYEVLAARRDSSGNVVVSTTSFSTFITYTVDFHYEDATFSVPGGSGILLSELFSALSIEREIADVVDVSFSNTELISVTGVDGDWRLSSLQPFTSTEILTVCFSNGEKLELEVTDATDTGYVDGIWHVDHVGEGMAFHFACALGGGTFTVRLIVKDNGTEVYNDSEGSVITSATFWVNMGGNDYWYEVAGSQNMGNVDYTALSDNKRVIGTGAYSIGSWNPKVLTLNRYTREIFGNDNAYATVWQTPELVMNGDTAGRNVVIYLDGTEVARKDNVLFPDRGDDHTLLASDLDVITPRSGYYKRGDVGGADTVTVSGTTYNVHLVTRGTVAYDANGGTGAPDSQYKYHGINLALSGTQPTKAYSTFKGWASSKARADAGTVDYKAGADYTSNLKAGTTATLYAVWEYSDSSYTVKHYKQDLTSGSYSEATEDRQTIGAKAYASVTPPVNAYEGFISPSVQTVTVNGDGSTLVSYYYDRRSFTVSLNGGTGISAVSGSGSYKFGQSVTINASVEAGYVWSGWTGAAAVSDQSHSFEMPASNVSYTANAVPAPYSISYDLDGGTVSSENPVSYTADTPTFTLINPTRPGYSFAGWTGTGLDAATMTVTVEKGSSGDRSYKANWKRDTGTLMLDHEGTGAAIVTLRGEDLEITFVLDKDIAVTGLPTGTYSLSVSGAAATLTASADNTSPTVTADGITTVAVRASSRSTNWFTGSSRAVNTYGG